MTIASALAEDRPNILVQGLTRLRDGIRWLILGPMVQEFTSRRVVDDPDTRWASVPDLRAAQARLAGNGAAVAEAVRQLGARAEAYEALTGALADDVMARDALQRMLLDGRLTGPRDHLGAGDLLDHLARLQRGPLAPGLTAKALISHLVEEAENPTKLAQEGKGTCVATTATIVLARKSPAEYARLVADLARPEGTSVAAGGATLTRSPDWQAEDDGGRTPSVRLLQPALMELGNGPVRYDNGRDRHAIGRWAVLPGGLGTFGADRVLEALTGEAWRTVPLVNRLTRSWAFEKVRATTAAGRSVPVGVMWEGGGHKILVDAIKGDTVHFTNPWGQRETMGVAEFRANMMDANLPG
ncbi:MAG: hypothetical protein VKS61_18850 [Candidatus Sericytochromatia bacterium]|nr:hypothetical protein [Candidatus Sericytochromatia bacterium]